MQPSIIQLSDSAIIDAPLSEVYEKLLNPQEQLKWNTLYLSAHTTPAGPIQNGTVMTGTFKGSGKATVHFEQVIPNDTFTHYSRLMMFNLLYLGEFRHTYRVEDVAGKTKFTQTVFVEPRGLGKLLKKVLIDGFRKRLPESFAEFKRYAENPATR